MSLYTWLPILMGVAVAALVVYAGGLLEAKRERRRYREESEARQQLVEAEVNMRFAMLAERFDQAGDELLEQPANMDRAGKDTPSLAGAAALFKLFAIVLAQDCQANRAARDAVAAMQASDEARR